MGQRGEHGAVVDLHVQMHYEIALLRRVRETLREIAWDDFLFPKDLEDVGVV